MIGGTLFACCVNCRVLVICVLRGIGAVTGKNNLNEGWLVVSGPRASPEEFRWGFPARVPGIGFTPVISCTKPCGRGPIEITLFEGSV